jgi:hypothetical protein
MPVLAPITAAGLSRSVFVSTGRDTQSSAFLSCPGMEWLYSGVAKSTASATAIRSRRSTTARGGSCRSSSSKAGICFRRS